MTASLWSIMRSTCVGLVLYGGLCCAAPSTANADTTITFNNLSLGFVTTQYEPQGVVFATGPNGAGLQPLVRTIGGFGVALYITTLIPDFPETELWGQFPSNPRQNVTFSVGDESNTTHPLELDGVDASGNVVASATVTLHGGAAPITLSVHSNAANITFFHIYVPSRAVPPSAPSATTDTNARVFAESMTFDNPVGAPDFAVLIGTIPNNTITLVPGEAYPVQLTLERLSGSSGPINFAISGPPGISASLSPPSPETGGSGSAVVMQVSAPPGTAPVNGQLSIVASPSSMQAGLVPHSYSIPIDIPALDTPRVKGIEVTQGIQCFGYSAQSDPPCQSALGLPARGSTYGATAAYNGVPLVTNVPTVVRVFADVIGAPPGGIPGFTVLLHGFNSTGKELTGSPLLPVFSPPNLVDSLSPTVTTQEQLNSAAAFEFELPWEWTLNAQISLEAELLPPVPSFSSPPIAMWCSDPASCPLTALTLTNVNFAQVSQPGIPAWGLTLPVQLTWNATPPPAALPTVSQALAGATKVTPDAVLSFLNYLSDIDITWIANGCPTSAPPPFPPLACTARNAQSAAVLDMLNNWYDDQTNLPTLDGWINTYSLVLGLENGSLPLGSDLGMESSNENSYVALAVANTQRPLTSIAHEIGHSLGRLHASPCTNSTSPAPNESWPPDQQGFIQGIGLDTASNLPFTINAPGVTGEPNQWFDFMSYCASSTETPAANLDAWISVKGWREVLSYLSHYNGFPAPNGTSPSASGSATAAAAGGNSPALWATASLESDGTVQILSVGTHTYKRAPAGSLSPYSLVVRDVNGKVVATAPLTAQMFHRAHGDPGGTRLQAAAPVRNADRVEITQGGKVVASRSRSKVPMTLVIAKPVAGEHAESLVTSWKMTARDGPGIAVNVDYSADTGNTWRTVYSGHDKMSVTLPSRFLPASDQARIRVRVNDGFADATAVSDVFAWAGAPPEVAIERPGVNAVVQSDETVWLAGFAFDDRQVPLTGSRLQWFALAPDSGPLLLGTGARVSAANLRPGVNAIELVATDRRGRRGTASVPITVANALQFLELGLPQQLPSSSSALTFNIRTSLPGTLAVRTRDQDLSQAKTFPVDRTQRTIRLPVAATRDPILLNLTLSANGARTERVVMILRTW